MRQLQMKEGNSAGLFLSNVKIVEQGRPTKNF